MGKKLYQIINRGLFDAASFVFRKENRVVTQKTEGGVNKHKRTESCPWGINIIGCFIDNNFNACDERWKNITIAGNIMAVFFINILQKKKRMACDLFQSNKFYG